MFCPCIRPVFAEDYFCTSLNFVAYFNLLHSERPKLYKILAFLSAIGLYKLRFLHTEICGCIPLKVHFKSSVVSGHMGSVQEMETKI